MRLLIDGKEAILPKNLSIEYSEGNDFFEEGSFSLSIELPIKGCEKNRAIFGSVLKHEQELQKTLYYGVLEDGSFLREGALAIDHITETSVFVQFVTGQSEQALHSTLDETYIDEMDYPLNAIYDALDSGEEISESIAISVPWYNPQEPDIIHNDGEYTTRWNHQPNLLWLTRQVLRQAGFPVVDLGDWSNSAFANLYIINALPDVAQYNDINKILPHWTVSEFMEQIALLLNAVWVIDYERKRARLDFLLMRTYPRAFVPSNKRIDQMEKKLTGELRDAPARGFGVKYSDSQTELAYIEKCESFMQAVRSEDDALRNDPYTDETGHQWHDTIQDHYRDTIGDFIKNADWQYQDYMCADIDYITDNDAFFGNVGRQDRLLWAVIGARKTPYICLCSDYSKSGKYLWPHPINVAGASVATKMKECKIVPVPMAFPHTELKFDTISEMYKQRDLGYGAIAVFDIAVPETDTETTSEPATQPPTPSEIALQSLSQRSEETGNSLFDRLNVAFYSSALLSYAREKIEEDAPTGTWQASKYVGARCSTDFYLFERKFFKWGIEQKDYKVGSAAVSTRASLRREFIEGNNTLVGSRRLDMSATYTFRFISDGMPEVRAVYDIDGVLYFPKKITCNISVENGISAIKKMECYRVI